METKKIPIAEATEQQLRDFAESYLGISVPHNTKLETLRAKVSQAWTKDEIIVEVADAHQAQEGTPPPPATPEQQPPGKKQVRILIQRTDEPGGDEAVPIGVNGRVMLVPRGQEVDIPEDYYQVLKNAVTHRYEALPDGGINPEPRKVPAYPFQVLHA
ncbi:hypothetical protein [Fodinicurvata sediminis]|uniref:hypothetical protein n=1 Tax=Fodinicurvata sediminis TaxID=1121832 RepID=UPI0003B76C71|nr:hypothetical protein [Fodinicurvata sediminis]